MNKTNDFKYNLPAYSDPVDIEDLNDNFRGIDDALMAGLCKKDYTGNNMGSSDPSARKYAWAPWFEIVNDNEFDVVVTDRNAPVESEEATINIAAGQTFRKYINGRYYMNFYVQDQYDVTFKWFTNAETYINESGGGGGGTGTVTSVSVQGGSGSHLTGSGNPIETSGTITINVDEGYSIPSDDEQTAWDGKAADLKAEINSSTYVMTLQLKDSSGNLIGNERTIDLPLETMVVDGEYDPQTQKIKLELKNGNYVEFSVADLVSGLQTELSSSNKLDPAFIAYDSTHAAVTEVEKNTYAGKQNALTFDDAPTSGSNNPVKSGGVYTALSGKQDTISDLSTIRSGASTGATAVQPSSLVDIVNDGAKNHVTINSGSYTATSADRYAQIPLEPITGTIVIDFGTLSTSQSRTSTCAVVLANSSGTNVVTFNLTPGSDVRYETTVSDTITLLKLYPASEWGTTADGDTVTWSNLMVTTKSQHDISPTYESHALGNQILTPALIEQVDSGAKNLMPNLGVKNHGDVTYTWNSDGSITISGTKAAGAECYVNVIDNVPYTSLGFKAGDKLAFSNNNDIGFITVIFYASGSGYTSAIAVQNESKEITLPSDKTNILVRLAVPAATTSVNVTIKPMMCTLADWNVSHNWVPHRLPLSDNTWVKSADLFPSHRTEFDVSNSHVYTYTNKFLNKVVVSVTLKAATAITTTHGILAIASAVSNIPPKYVFNYIVQPDSDYECFIIKNNTNGSLAFKVTTGTMASGTILEAQFEYTYGLN